MVKYPLLFNVSAESAAGISTVWKTRAGELDFSAAIPPEFEGPGGGSSPEDFYALALLNCFIATFKVIAERSKITFERLSANGVLTVDRDESGHPWMKHFSLTVNLMGATDRERAQRVLEKASQSCLILNSVKTEKKFEFLVA